MKILTVVLLFGVMYCAGQVTSIGGRPDGGNQREPLAKVEGKSLNSLSGMPVGKVTLTLRREDPVQALKYTAVSDAEGRFRFDQVAPGPYTLYAEKPGFVRQYYGARRDGGNGTPLMLSEGQLVKELLFKLTPQSIVSGKVTDETGEAMDKVSVSLMRWGYSQGRRLVPAGGALTNDMGEYRIASVSPGSYYVAAHRGDIVAGLRVIRADVPSAAVPEAPEEGYKTTYYPSAIDPAGAGVLQVGPGSELSGVDIQFRKVRVFRLRGQVVNDATGQPVADVMVTLTPSRNNGVIGMSSLGGPRIPGGRFEVTGVLPGTYDLMAQVTRSGQTLYARHSVYVSDRNVTDIVIRMPEPIDVSGRVQISMEARQTLPQQQQQRSQQAFRMESVRIFLYPADGFGLGSLPQANAQADGSFVLRNVVPDKFRVRVSGTAPGWYLKSILMGGRVAPDGIVDLTGGGAVEIILGMGAAEVTGSVVDADDKPASGVMVTLVPEDASKMGRIDLFRIATSDQNGQFQVGDVVPGSYKIFAWQEVEPAAAQDPEFRRPFEDKGASLTLNENARETVRLKAISAEAVGTALRNRPNM